MPDTSTLATFVVASLVLLVIPGPAVVYVVGRSLSQGQRAGLVSVLGLHTGTLVHIAAAVVGLSALVLSSATAFTFVKLAGAAYLIGLGILTLARRGVSGADAARPSKPLRALYLQGIAIEVLNPKTAVFFLAFFPQFVRADGAPTWAQLLFLGAIFVTLGVLSDGIYALLASGVGSRVRNRLSKPGLRRPWVAGTTYVALGLLAAAAPGNTSDH